MSVISVRPYLTGSGDQGPNIQAALNAASAAGGGAVIIDRDLAPMIQSVVNVPANCSLQGEFNEVWPRKAAALIGRGSTIQINISANSAATIQLNENSGIQGIIVRPFGMTFPQSAAQVSTWAGTAVTRVQAAHGVFVRDCTVVGFQYAVKDQASVTYAERFYCDNFRFDCVNGIYLQAGSDILTFNHTTGWPLAADDNGPLADQYRSGTAFYLVGNGSRRIDAPEFLQCFAFGYAAGFHLTGVGDARLIGCYVDYPATKPSYFINGFVIDSGIPNVQLIGCHSYNTNRGFQFSPTGNSGLIQMTNCTAENVSDQGFYADSGAGIISACAFLGPTVNGLPTAMQEGVLTANAPGGSKFSVESCYFNGTNYAVLSQTTHTITYGNANITGPLGSNTVAT